MSPAGAVKMILCVSLLIQLAIAEFRYNPSGPDIAVKEINEMYSTLETFTLKDRENLHRLIKSQLREERIKSGVYKPFKCKHCGYSKADKKGCCTCKCSIFGSCAKKGKKAFMNFCGPFVCVKDLMCFVCKTALVPCNGVCCKCVPGSVADCCKICGVSKSSVKSCCKPLHMVQKCAKNTAKCCCSVCTTLKCCPKSCQEKVDCRKYKLTECPCPCNPKICPCKQTMSYRLNSVKQEFVEFIFSAAACPLKCAKKGVNLVGWPLAKTGMAVLFGWGMGKVGFDYFMKGEPTKTFKGTVWEPNMIYGIQGKAEFPLYLGFTDGPLGDALDAVQEPVYKIMILGDAIRAWKPLPPGLGPFFNETFFGKDNPNGLNVFKSIFGFEDIYSCVMWFSLVGGIFGLFIGCCIVQFCKSCKSTLGPCHPHMLCPVIGECIV